MTREFKSRPPHSSNSSGFIPNSADKEAVTTSSSITGKLVTETLDYDGGRQVTAYVPPVPPEAVVFAGDGPLIPQWGRVLQAADLPPTMIIGAHRLGDEMQRLHEYSPVFDAGNGSRRTRSSLSKTSANGRSHVSESRCPPSARRCVVFPLVESSRSPWGFAIPASTVRSSACRRAEVTDRLP
jgi:hypothetical protein